MSFSRSRDAWLSFSDEIETSNDLMWMVLSVTSRLVRDRPGRDEPRAIKNFHQSKYAKLKTPRPSRAKRIAAQHVKPIENPSVHAIRSRLCGDATCQGYRGRGAPKGVSGWRQALPVASILIHAK